MRYGNEATNTLIEGFTALAKAVKVTLGPSGRNVFIKPKGEAPFNTKDGATVAGHIGSEDPMIMAAMESIRDVANLSDEVAGDGTTTATILAEAILEGGNNLNGNVNLIDVKRGIENSVKEYVSILKEKAIEIKDDAKMLRQVALISSNYDEEAADLVYDAFKIAGRQGIVNIKRSKTFESYNSSIEGMTLPMGFRSIYYINDIENQVFQQDDCYVYMTNKKIDKMQGNFQFLLEQVVAEESSLLIICKDMDISISDVLVREASKANIKVCVCSAPGFGNEQSDHLKDLGVVLGKEPFIENEGIDFDHIPADEILDYLPISSSIIVSKDVTSIKGPATDDEEFLKKIEIEKQERADYLRSELEKHNTEYEKSQIQTRISRISDGIAYINIGAYSDTEYKEKQARIQDALYSIKCAAEEGIIPGGGSALLSVSKIGLGSKNHDMRIGIDILNKAIQKPFKQIIANVGTSLSERKIDFCKSNWEAGYDAKSKRVVPDMIEAGIIDPVKVTRTALENAASIAGMLLTTECMIVDTDAYEKPKQFGY
jgi:chaperonin GroEL